MASVPFDVLFDPLDRTDLPLEVDPDDAVEIGAVSNVVSTTVSLTKFRDGDGELVFSDEIPVSMYTEWRELQDGPTRHDKKTDNSGPDRWVRVELKVASNPNTISSGHTLVATRWPRGNAWFHQTKFKPVWKGLKDQKPQPGTDVNTFPKLLRWLDATPFDYWETRSGVLTAGLSRPKRDGWEETRDAKEKSFTLMGVCADFDKCLSFLKGSKKVGMLQSNTKQGTIAFGHANLAETAKAKRLKLYDGLIDEALIYLEVAMRQALAGDVNPSRWSGRPVIDLVDEIYREYLNNLNRRENRRRWGGSGGSSISFEDGLYYGEEYNEKRDNDEDN